MDDKMIVSRDEYITAIIENAVEKTYSVVLCMKSRRSYSGKILDIFKYVIKMIENGNKTTITYVMLSEIESIKIIK